MSTAIEAAISFHAMTDHLDTTVFTRRGEGMDRTLEAIEGVRVPIGRTHLESLIVLISADFALGHTHLLLPEAERFPVFNVNTLGLARTNAQP
jgi:hypothetical protein